MKYFVILILCLMAFSCSQHEKQSTITGEITLIDNVSPEKIFIGLYPFRNKNYIGSPVQFIEQKETKFTLTVDPGVYILVVYSLETELAKGFILVPDNKANIKANIQLPQIGIDNEIKSVKIIGKFCKWIRKNGVDLVQQGSKWILQDTTMLKKGDPYNFYINEQTVFDINQKNITAIKNDASINNIYTGEKIIFDPLQYKQPRAKATISTKGFKHNKKFTALLDDIENYEKLVRKSSQESVNLKVEEYQEKYVSLIQSLDSLEKSYDPFFAQYFLEYRIGNLRYTDPAFKAMRRLWVKGEPDSARLENYYLSDIFTDYFSKHLTYAQKLDPKSILVKGRFANNFLALCYDYEKSPGLKNKYNLGENYFYDFVLNFVKKSPFKKAGTNILYSAGSYYARRDEPEKTKYLINLLKNEYADDFYVGKGHADKILASLKVVIGAAAPDFRVKTLAGDILCLSDLKGKFVMIDFWGSWCGPCRGEIPNFKRLAETIPIERLQLIGLANDDSVSLVNYIKKENIQYPNALAPKSVLDNYGISAFPTTFLIDPDGKICGKNLRGEKLIEKVKQKMVEYEQRKH